jgi:hypothetical protein
MATNFPTNIDTFTDQTSSDLITSAKWNNLQDSIEALEVKVGADNSTVTTSHDYKLAELATTLGAITSAADVADFEKLHAITSTHTEINQLHESGVVKADLEKLHDITVEAARINTIGKIKARAYLNAAQDIDATSSTKVLIDTISFDTEGVVDIANSRITPSLPGYYQVSAQVYTKAVPDGERVLASICKNGIDVSAGSGVRSGAQGDGVSVVSDLIYMNGTTDYLELYANNTHSSALALDAGPSYKNYISIVGPF